MADMADCLHLPKIRCHLLSYCHLMICQSISPDGFWWTSTHTRPSAAEMSRICMHQPHLALLGHPRRPRVISCIQIWLQRLTGRAVCHKQRPVVPRRISSTVHLKSTNVASDITRQLHRHHLASSRLGIGSQSESALVSQDSAFSDTDRQVAHVT